MKALTFKNKYIFLLLTSFVLLFSVLLPVPVFAAEDCSKLDTPYEREQCYTKQRCANLTDPEAKELCLKGTPLSPGERDFEDPALDCNPQSNAVGGCNLWRKYLNPFIAFLSALVGIAVTIALVWGGIKYSMAAGDSNKVSQARHLIRNAIIALVLYIMLYAALNWIIPGGFITS